MCVRACVRAYMRVCVCVPVCVCVCMCACVQYFMFAFDFTATQNIKLHGIIVGNTGKCLFVRYSFINTCKTFDRVATCLLMSTYM